MAKITIGGNEIETKGTIPSVGSKAPNFKLVTHELSDKTLDDYKGTRVIMNIYPSVDTGICAISTKKFNEEASKLANTKILCISRDLPFAQKRFCDAEGIDNLEMLSDFKNGQFGDDYNLEMTSGPLSGLHSRVILVLDEEGTILYSEQVPEIVQEPDYNAALNHL